MNKQQLYNYLKVVLSLEVQKRTLEETYRKKKLIIKKLKMGDSIEKPGSKPSFPWSGVICGVVIFLLFWWIGSIFDGVWGAEAIIGIPMKLVGCLGIYMIIHLIRAYNQDSEYYDREVKTYNDALEKNQIKLQRNVKIVQVLENECTMLGQQWNRTKEVLERYYSLNVVYKDYRELIPIAMFVQYIESGRCNSLTGHEGAYNIYHQELIAKIILKKLDEILAETRNTQWLLREVINESNSKIDSMCMKLNMIEQHEATNAYYNEISARNTQFLKDYTIYKNLLS